MPTFRGDEGLWKDHRPEELATPSAFRRDPRLVWEWYAWRRETAAGCEPNAAHGSLARWTLRAPGVWIATQNVDGLHGEALRRASTAASPESTPGTDAAEPAGAADGPGPAADAASARERLLELHGSLFRVRCTGCGRREEHRGTVDASSRDALPRCDGCGALLRPDVVWFGESLDADVLDAARRAAEAADACLVVGTSAVVQPAASLAAVASRAGAAVIEVNPEATPMSGRADVTLRAGAAEILPGLLDA